MVLHGRDGGNTLRPFSSVAEAYGGTFGLAVGAFLLGYLVHVVGDAVFHPLVLYTVGKGPGRSQYEHHVFESALDLYVWEHWGKEPGIPKTLRQLTQGMERTGELSRKEFLQLLGKVSFLGSAYSEEGLQTCLRRYEILQNWFWAPLACKVTQVLKAINRDLAFLEASCYQRRFYRYSEAFTNSLEYLHPVTGVEGRVLIEDLVKETVERFFTYAAHVEELFQQAVIETKGAQVDAGASDRENSEETWKITGGETAAESDKTPIALNRESSSAPKRVREGLPEGFRSLKGPNLETGIYGDRADRILYKRPEGLEGIFGPYGYRYQ